MNLAEELASHPLPLQEVAKLSLYRLSDMARQVPGTRENGIPLLSLELTALGNMKSSRQQTCERFWQKTDKMLGLR